MIGLALLLMVAIGWSLCRASADCLDAVDRLSGRGFVVTGRRTFVVAGHLGAVLVGTGCGIILYRLLVALL